MTVTEERARRALTRRGFALEWATLGWNVAGVAVLAMAGLALNAALGWWWADPAAGYVLVYYAAREIREIFWAGPG